MHSSKGLEWPVVVPINTATVSDQPGLVRRRRAHGRPAHERLPAPPRTAPLAAIEAEKEEHARERHRIWYVAATRARELLVLPRPSCGIKANWWVGMVEPGVCARSEVLDIVRQSPAVPACGGRGCPRRDPTPSTFAAQAASHQGQCAYRSRAARRISRRETRRR